MRFKITGLSLQWLYSNHCYDRKVVVPEANEDGRSDSLLAGAGRLPNMTEINELNLP
jgi:hypothetical protein